MASSSLELVTTISRICCASRSDLVPDSDGVEQAASSGDNRGRARIAARPDRKRRIRNNNGNIGAKPLAQCQRQGKARKCATADDNALLVDILDLLTLDYCQWIIAL